MKASHHVNLCLWLFSATASANWPEGILDRTFSNVNDAVREIQEINQREPRIGVSAPLRPPSPYPHTRITSPRPSFSPPHHSSYPAP